MVGGRLQLTVSDSSLINDNKRPVCDKEATFSSEQILSVKFVQGGGVWWASGEEGDSAEYRNSK